MFEFQFNSINMIRKENLNCGGYFLLWILRLLDGVRATHSSNRSVLVGDYDLYSNVFFLAVGPQPLDLISVSVSVHSLSYLESLHKSKGQSF